MRILGIDCGCEATGYGIIETDGRRHRLIAEGAIRTSARQAFPERLRRIAAELAQLMVRFGPLEVAVEEVFFAANVKSALRLGHVRGVALLEAARAGYTVSEYSALEVKSSVVGYGRAEKPQVQKMVQALLNLPAPPESADAADALALAICHAHRAHAQKHLPPAGAVSR
jgi:crossover junction endodeoxyribonuclease RuvC